MSKPARRAPRQAEAERNDRAVLQAAREVLATDGAHASVAAIAERAGVGIGTLYRRYRTKEELFQHLVAIVLGDYLAAAQEGLAHEDPWAGLVHYVTSAIGLASGSLAPIAGTIAVTPEMADRNERADDAVRALVDRAHDSGALRPDVTQVDLELLIEQLAKSPLLEQLKKQGRTDLLDAAMNARTRITAIAVDGLRAPAPHPLPGDPPGYELFSERWEPPPVG
ncbi:TetR family transcriptional regulator [Herbihabitans rhizosphaerae]|uniref:TetR family transcriptional regulator n=1 Tax=Herbihabitans rhizosphaerae TaxID=1872711 RepID=A0A4V2EUK4_9PSEU|nr:TetR/AcrR family transcriptional regulator [Herbihabitans rhizosphaerae]RZS44883.1 TetR family transcriptional regulator [Herbihabitans rhizosphaerae]